MVWFHGLGEHPSSCELDRLLRVPFLFHRADLLSRHPLDCYSGGSVKMWVGKLRFPIPPSSLCSPVANKGAVLAGDSKCIWC